MVKDFLCLERIDDGDHGSPRVESVEQGDKEGATGWADTFKRHNTPSLQTSFQGLDDGSFGGQGQRVALICYGRNLRQRGVNVACESKGFNGF